MAFSRWAVSHGGVYVPVDERTRPSPYLSHIPNRDVMRPDGTVLTLMNPAHMARELNEDPEDLCESTGHITSMKALGPGNGPDAWEHAALAAFERGDKEVLAFADIGGVPHVRLMRPLVTEEGCLTCHVDDGYRAGEVQGGVGVALPISAHLRDESVGLATLTASYGGLWLLGVGAIFAAARDIRRRIRSNQRSEEELHRSQAQYRSLVDNTLAVTYRCALDADWTMRYISSAIDSLTGYPASDFIDNAVRTYESVIHREDSAEVSRATHEAVDAGRAWEIEYRVCHKGRLGALGVREGSRLYGRRRPDCVP